MDWEDFEVHAAAGSNTLEKGEMFSMCEEDLTNWRKERSYTAEARGEFYDEMDVSMCLDDLYKNSDEGNIRAQTFVELGVDTHPDRAYRGFKTWWDELFRGEGSDEDGAGIRELWEEMVQRLNPVWKSEREKNLGILATAWNSQNWQQEVRAGLEELELRCTKCLTQKQARCEGCDCLTCGLCRRAGDACKGCTKCYTEEEAKAMQEKRERVLTKYGRLAVNLHKLGTDFVGEIVDVSINSEEDRILQFGDELLFKCAIKLWKPHQTEVVKKGKEAKMLRELLEGQHGERNRVLFFPQRMFPSEDPEFGEKGWWYTPTAQVQFRECGGCGRKCMSDEFTQKVWNTGDGYCLKCRAEECTQRKNKRRRTTSNKCAGVLCRTADPRYVGRGDERSGGDIVFDLDQIRNYVNNLDAIENETSNWAWLTSREMGFALEKEVSELEHARDRQEGRQTVRRLAPQISAFVKKARQTDGQLISEQTRDLLEIVDDWIKRGLVEESESECKSSEWLEGGEFGSGDVQQTPAKMAKRQMV